MQDIVILPTYDRPELLWLCLDYFAACPDSPPVSIRIYVDSHIGQVNPPPRKEIERVIEKFPQLSIQVRFRPSHPYYGNSYNVLMAYKDVYENTDAEFVFLVEDDVLIHPMFFAWHHLVHLNLELGCSIAVLNPGHGAYASLGVCFRRPMLKLITPHCKPAYFQNMQKYCQRIFGSGKFDTEQDGLWARVLKGHQVVWAEEPYAQHVGWYGYHRKKSIRPKGSLEDRYHQVKHVLTNQEILSDWVRDFQDIQLIRPLT